MVNLLSSLRNLSCPLGPSASCIRSSLSLGLCFPTSQSSTRFPSNILVKGVGLLRAARHVFRRSRLRVHGVRGVMDWVMGLVLRVRSSNGGARDGDEEEGEGREEGGGEEVHCLGALTNRGLFVCRSV